MENKNNKKNEMSELEKITRKAIELVACPLEKCQIRGEYFRCYTNSYKECTLFLYHKD